MVFRSDVEECSKGFCGEKSVQCSETDAPGYYMCICKDGYSFNGTYGTGCTGMKYSHAKRLLEYRIQLFDRVKLR